MPSYNPPLKAAEFIFSVALFSVLNDLLLTPTISSGDFQVSKDFGAFSNLGTLPVVSPAGSGQVQVTLSATEMDADVVVVRWIDPGAEWVDGLLTVHTAEKQFGDIPDVASIVTGVWNESIAEPTAAFDWAAATPREIIGWLAALAKNKIIQTTSESTLRNDDDDADIATSQILESGSTYIRDRWQ